MELHQLRYFCAVARTGNFTRAAAAEYVAQPSLSQQILKLEEELGVKLIDRLGREARLTDAGKALLPKAQAILKQIVDAKREVQELAGTSKGEVAIGVIPTIAPYFLPRKLAEFAAELPDIHVHVLEDITPALMEALHAGALDLALMALPVAGREYSSHEVAREALYAVVPASHRLAAVRAVRLEQLENEPFLLMKEGHCFRDTVISACKRARMGVNIVFESGQFATILAMVGAGAGVSIVPEMAVQEHAGCKFLRIDDTRAERRIGVVHLKRHYLSRGQMALLRYLRSTSDLPLAKTA